MNDLMAWIRLPLQSEPWAIGPLQIGRRNGKIFPMVGPNQQLKSFQEAVKEELEGTPPLAIGQYKLTFYIWRDIESYDGQGKKVKKHQVDATNIQKGLEDALQGILFDNDRSVRDVRTVVVEQAEGVTPRIVIHAELWRGFDTDEIPDWIWSEIQEHDELPSQTEEDYKNADPLF